MFSLILSDQLTLSVNATFQYYNIKYNTNGKKVYTNGTTIDVSKDSIGSAIFGYGKEGVIKLTSPKLALSNSILSNEETKKEEEDKKTDANKEQDKTVTEETKTATGNDLDESPKTADEYEVMAYILVAACGLVLMVGSGLALNKKRNR